MENEIFKIGASSSSYRFIDRDLLVELLGLAHHL